MSRRPFLCFSKPLCRSTLLASLPSASSKQLLCLRVPFSASFPSHPIGFPRAPLPFPRSQWFCSKSRPLPSADFQPWPLTWTPSPAVSWTSLLGCPHVESWPWLLPPPKHASLPRKGHHQLFSCPELKVSSLTLPFSQFAHRLLTKAH